MKLCRVIFYCLIGFCWGLGIPKIYALERTDSIPKLKVHYQVSFNGNYSENIAEQFLATTNNSINFQKGSLGFTQLLNYQYSTFKSSPSAAAINLLNETLTTSRLAYQINKTEPFALFGFERSNVRSIKTRYYSITGVDYKLLNKKTASLSPLIGLCSESTIYKDKSNYNHYFIVFGARGFHAHAQNKFRIQYDGYFFRHMAKNRWRYQGALTGMIQIIKPLYASVNLNALSENILGQDTSPRITTISFGLTFRK